jgi:hypothetical protein
MYIVVIVPTALGIASNMIKGRVLGKYKIKEDADERAYLEWVDDPAPDDERAYLEWVDDPAPDKADYYRIEVIEYPKRKEGD